MKRSSHIPAKRDDGDDRQTNCVAFDLATSSSTNGTTNAASSTIQASGAQGASTVRRATNAVSSGKSLVPDDKAYATRRDTPTACRNPAAIVPYRAAAALFT